MPSSSSSSGIGRISTRTTSTPPSRNISAGRDAMAAPAEPSSKSASSLTLRLISAAVLIPIVALAAYAGKPAWDFLVIAFGAVMVGEWCQIAGRRADPAQPGGRIGMPNPAPETMVAIGLVVEGL